ncbi:MAG: sporulation protein YunB [Firmicutes bacterium]|nr:sporulation protein YunB [Bacillota bacterium]
MKGDRRRVARMLGISLILCILALATSTINRILEPSLGSVAELQVKSMIHRSVNEAVAESFSEGRMDRQLMQVTTAGDGHVTMIQADMAVMNEVASVLTGRIQNKISSLGEECITVPWGNVLGSQILTQMGPKLKLRVIPIGMAEVGFKTEFESSAINQTRHRIYLEVCCTARILAPFTLAKVETTSQILMAETVIVGDTPQSYVFVPEESILDVVP